MVKDSDLLPWIMGGMLVVGAAVAAAVGLDGTTASTSNSPNDTGARPTVLPQSSNQSSPTPPAVAADLTPVAVSPTARPLLPPGQVWECVINGQRVFSDAQCGAHASIRQLSEVNVMNSRPAPGPYGAYGSYGAGYYPPPLPPADTDEPDYSSSVGPGVIVVRERPRRDHIPRRDSHPHARPHSN
jgi:hypothetical protein